MTASEIQKELSSAEAWINSFQKKIKEMDPPEEKKVSKEFELIMQLAYKYPLKNPILMAACEMDKRYIIESLSFLIQIQESGRYERLLYLCRLARGIAYDKSAEDIYKLGIKVDEIEVKNFCMALEDYKYTCLVEMLIIANIPEKASEDILAFISGIAEILGCDEEELKVVATVAKARISENYDILDNIFRLSAVQMRDVWVEQLKTYIPEKWIVGRRMKCAELCTKKHRNPNLSDSTPSFMMNVIKNKNIIVPNFIESTIDQQGKMFFKGDSIMIYQNKISDNDICPQCGQINSSKTKFCTNCGYAFTSDSSNNSGGRYVVTAPKDGLVFDIEIEKGGNAMDLKDTYRIVYLTSCFDNYQEIENWAKSQLKIDLYKQIY